ncbi:Uncharacterized protein TCM_027952 [Theobroma cacao]|uniref:Uncharacterized protein n=1 Tax=Theobroma cacao TaxID=3641 RepID=A0A061GH55_THECC|nr:Uncharacterized protein TCM_027952 [Theobroma cacao]
MVSLLGFEMPPKTQTIIGKIFKQMLLMKGQYNDIFFRLRIEEGGAGLLVIVMTRLRFINLSIEESVNQCLCARRNYRCSARRIMATTLSWRGVLYKCSKADYHSARKGAPLLYQGLSRHHDAKKSRPQQHLDF